jgi:hypothetical protein
MKKIVLLGVVLITIYLVSSCKKDDGFDDITPVYLVSSENTSYDVSTLKGNLQSSGLQDLAASATYDVRVFKVRYKTTFNGQSVEASGLVAAPVNLAGDKEFPMMSFQHGDLTRDQDAPTNSSDAGIYAKLSYMASIGLIVVIPDYVGYGATADTYHPYMLKDLNVVPILDMIKAAKELVIDEKVCKYNDNLFLSGLSEGANFSLAALSEIENGTKYSDLKVTASACCSGVYDLVEFHNWMVSQPQFENPFFIAAMLESFSKYGGLTMDYSLVFSNSFATKISGIVDGTKTIDAINSSFGTYHVGELFNDNFEDTSKCYNIADYDQLHKLFIDNSIPVWNLESEVTLYYWKSDIWVPSDQTFLTYLEFKASTDGDTSGDAKIKINATEGASRDAANLAMLAKAIQRFKNTDWNQ